VGATSECDHVHAPGDPSELSQGLATRRPAPQPAAGPRSARRLDGFSKYPDPGLAGTQNASGPGRRTGRQR